MQNHTDKSRTYPLIAMLALLALSGSVQVAVGPSERSLAHVLSIVLSVLVSFSAFVWYCRDSDLYRYRRSLWRNILFIAFGILFIPWYLVRTRPNGKRLLALLGLGGVGMLVLVALLVGATAGFVLGRAV